MNTLSVLRCTSYLPLFAFLLTNYLALFAKALSFVGVIVAFAEVVAALAVCLCGVLYAHTSPAAKVFFEGNRLKVVGIDAGTIAAKMVNRQAVRNQTLHELIDNSVRLARLETIEAKAPVPVILEGHPHPTAILIHQNLFPDADRKSFKPRQPFLTGDGRPRSNGDNFGRELRHGDPHAH